MKPLFVKEFCLNCHPQQGYTINEVRGGISLTLDVTETQEKMTRHVLVIVLFAVLALSFLMGLVWYFTRGLYQKIGVARKEIEEMAIADGLTGLFNRRYLEYRLGQEFQRAKRNHTSLSCMLMDLDHFKDINDTYGHGTGDLILKDVSQVIQRNVRDYDIVGRYGGEEFIVVLPHTSLGMAVKMAERVREKIKEHQVKDVSVTVSIGVTRNMPDDSSIDDIVKRADFLLYDAKEGGRDSVRATDVDL
jgi:diguanylate cyclase (GGDEF)-like protein